uniref:ARA70 domain-containing protein n=1 Tax=Steinernema glaseri TaxID=37863 RepID=A0A1I8AP58_9BILA
MSFCAHSPTKASLEHGLRQKLTMMENTSARLSSIRAQLRANSDQVRKDIGSSISQYLACIRNREQELINELESIVLQKERKLSEQQEQLNVAIGGCQQALECVMRTNKSDGINMQEMLFRLNTIDLSARETPQVTFEADHSALRKTITDFGRIKLDHQYRIMESLPNDIEEYDDGDTLAHKSVMTMTHTRIPANANKNSNAFSADHLRQWLGNLHLKTPELYDDFEVIRNRTVSMGSSIEILPKPDTECGVFSSHFSEDPVIETPTIESFLSRPKEHGWSSDKDNQQRFGLKSHRSTDDCNMKTDDMKDEPANSKKRRLACANDEPSSEKIEYDFGNVIKGIQRSDDSEWLLNAKESSSEMSSENSPSFKHMVVKQTTSEDPCEVPTKQKRVWYPTVGNANKESSWNNGDMSQWLMKDPKAKADGPINQMAQNVAVWESVIGWQKILEKIHASGENEWLLPSSRLL